MNTHLHNSDEIFSSAQYGWEQMKFLLDKNLPVTNKKNTWQLYAPYFAAASLLTIFLFSSLILQDGSHQNFSSKPLSKSVGNQLAVTKITQVRHKVFDAVNRCNYKKINKQLDYFAPLNSTEEEVPADNVIQSNATLWAITKNITNPTTEDDIKQPIEILNAANKSVKIITSLAAKDSVNTDSAIKTAVRLIYNNRSWNFSAGLGLNGMIGQRQNLQPYPVAELRYNITSHFFMSLGLSASSPVSTNSFGISKTVYLNDTANNVQLYNKVISYSRLYYAGIPLLAGINIGKRFSVQAGLQASILLNTKSKVSIEKYDFQMRLANGPQNNLVSGMTAVSENIYRMNERKIDYRFTTGLGYSINKTSFNLQYQYSLHPVLGGNNVTSNKNQLLTLSILYKIK